ncbi:phosphatidylethanolamine N-methyltransferase isoform X8 [Ailuropoda melanoleuca]|uniref:phosphatidylethanolamine N-methyltransferase isoform X8 n=1 Tax=Ailuropoda melanoleuca TaxID=9646 RepID=UPI001494E6E4|nr:phosphatidylethanolamine N-methyltransferase isoform X8 [Ailuropoda melanoleuca]
MPWRAPGQPRLAGTGNYISQKAERAWGHRESAPCGTASRYDRAALGDESAAARPRRRPSRGGPAQGTWRPGAEPMSSSVAGPDCCGGLGNVDFRQLYDYTAVTFAGRACAPDSGVFPEGRPLRYDPAAGLRGPLGSLLRGCRPCHHFQSALLECGTLVRNRFSPPALPWPSLCLSTPTCSSTPERRRTASLPSESLPHSGREL